MRSTGPNRQAIDLMIWGYLSCIAAGPGNGLSYEAAAHSRFEDSAAGRWAMDIYYCLQTKGRDSVHKRCLNAQVRKIVGDSRD